MATYKKTGSKAKKSQNTIEEHSTTADVFNTLDETASKSEQWVIKNQKTIFIILGLVVAIILGYLAYHKYVATPKEKEAANELAFPKAYFEDALSNPVATDSLFTLALNGADGKYGFVDISNEYSGTKAGNLANYYAGISYLRMKNYKDAIEYLEKFSSEDELLGPTAKGAIGDAFAQLDQKEDAFDYYVTAAQINNNMYSTPKYLYKAAMMGASIGKTKQALTFLKRIEKEFSESTEAELVGVQIGKLETLLK